MKFMLLIGGSHAAWDQVSPEAWAESEAAHGTLIDELRASGEFLECDELNVTESGARVVRRPGDSVASTPGPLSDNGNFASGYYLVNCRDIARAEEIAGRLHESRFAPIEVRQVGGAS
jgi:hypothetical protein